MPQLPINNKAGANQQKALVGQAVALGPQAISDLESMIAVGYRQQRLPELDLAITLEDEIIAQLQARIEEYEAGMSEEVAQKTKRTDAQNAEAATANIAANGKLQYEQPLTIGSQDFDDDDDDEEEDSDFGPDNDEEEEDEEEEENEQAETTANGSVATTPSPSFFQPADRRAGSNLTASVILAVVLLALSLCYSLTPSVVASAATLPTTANSLVIDNVITSTVTPLASSNGGSNRNQMSVVTQTRNTTTVIATSQNGYPVAQRNPILNLILAIIFFAVAIPILHYLMLLQGIKLPLLLPAFPKRQVVVTQAQTNVGVSGTDTNGVVLATQLQTNSASLVTTATTTTNQPAPQNTVVAAPKKDSSSNNSITTTGEQPTPNFAPSLQTTKGNKFGFLRKIKAAKPEENISPMVIGSTAAADGSVDVDSNTSPTAKAAEYNLFQAIDQTTQQMPNLPTPQVDPSSGGAVWPSVVTPKAANNQVQPFQLQLARPAQSEYVPDHSFRPPSLSPNSNNNSDAEAKSSNAAQQYFPDEGEDGSDREDLVSMLDLEDFDDDKD